MINGNGPLTINHFFVGRNLQSRPTTTLVRISIKRYISRYLMLNLMNFFKNYFLAAGIVWTLGALSILCFKFNFQTREITLTLLFPLAYAIIRLFDQSKQLPKAE